MPSTEQVSQGRLAELIGSLSLATDLAAGLGLEAALRICVLATDLARDLGLQGQALSDVYYAALLRFLGCTAYAHETAALMGGDDQAALRALWLMDTGSPGQLLSFVARDLGRGTGGLDRARLAARFLADPKRASKFANAHCDLAMSLARRLGMTDQVVTSLSQLYERFDGKGTPRGLKGKDIAVPARIVQVACRVEIHRGLLGPAAATETVRKRAKGELDPKVSEAFLKRAPELLARISAASVWSEFLAAEPEPRRLVPRTQRGPIARAFAQYVDMKSPYTLSHSTGVARLVARAAANSRRMSSDVEVLSLAALLHDLGRTSVPNGIWDKEGPLNLIEQERMQQHAYQTERILNQTRLFGEAARVAGLHHERLDGSGYHRRLSAGALPFGARLLAAADAFHAMTEPRAYRAALTSAQAADELLLGARTGKFDRAAVDAVLSAASGTESRTRAWPANLSHRDVEVLCLLARGQSPKAIGATLLTPTRTVQQHLQHIYERTEISTRAGAALFAVEQQLFEGSEGRQ